MRTPFAIAAALAFTTVLGCSGPRAASRGDACCDAGSCGPSDGRPTARSAPAAEESPAEAKASSPIKPLDNFHVVAEGRVYRSAQVRRETLEYAARELHVRRVLNLRGTNRGSVWYDAEQAACAELGIELIDVPLSASSLPSPENLLKLYDVLADADAGPLLVHCKAGADRTGMVAALWRMIAEGDDADRALRELTIRFGHFRGVHPEMSQLVRMFRPERTWIEQQYPAMYEAARHGAQTGKGDDE